ncbi:MAG: electron transfer flavoprotein subunit alpha/FixB family protein [Spirochaetales bacterium]|uniref:Electron transfer flavoprotein subunit alpha/FixB family protein n=1 Tax=Candidatus Thalassospirochaeta sargassi TaxID=3119039 RepID=A0AAJ1ICU4_9SPIO|nr:electron transfer flavoprotein subunit alpha/FixB family protein [Spirochaetales bacterium]
MKKVLIYIDPQAVKDSIDLLEAAEQIYGAGESLSYGIVPGTPPADVFGVFDKLISVSPDRAEGFDAAYIADSIEKLHRDFQFDAVLIPATVFGRMIAPRAAMRLQTGLVADVTEIRHHDEEIVMVRPAFSGRMLAGIVNRGGAPVMMSVRQNIFSYAGPRTKKTEEINFNPEPFRKPGIRYISSQPKPQDEDIRESNVLVSGGDGVTRYFDQLNELAEVLNGSVSASRKVVDRGAAPRHIQVGQSGKIVNPSLYIALGISGSIQHVVGIKNAENIIAVNPDRQAPICSLSNIVVEADAREFIPRIIKRIRKGEYK